jgi:L-gulonolactone oxidase
VRSYATDVLMDNAAFELVNRVARRFPSAIPRLNRLASAAAAQRRRVGPSHRVFASERRVRFEEMEYALPRERVVEGVRAARAILERHPVSFPIEVRFSAGDDALLSPAHGRATGYVAVHVYRGMAFEAPFREVEAELSALGGRPHWGKRSFLGAAELAPRYPRWDAFQAVRAELDPGRRFTSAWVRHVLG